MKSECLLLMTACIDPKAAGTQVVRRDPRVRLGDYLSALRFWLRLNEPRIRHILLVENSGYPLDELQDLARAEKPPGMEVEIIHAGDNEIPPGFTYAYPELRMMQNGVRTSRLWKEPPDTVIKVTGRLQYPRIPRLLDAVPDDFTFCGDSLLQRHALRFWETPAHMQSMLFLSRKPFFEREICTLWERMRPEPGHRILEDVLCRHMWDQRRKGNGKILMRFPVSCDPVGHSGFNDRSTDMFRRRLLNRTRAIARHVAPWWWI